MKKFEAKRGKSIGKIVMGCRHIHKSAIDILPEEELQFVKEKMVFLPKDFEFDIIKIDFKKRSVSFTRSKDWDTASEPEVGERYTVSSENTLKHSNSSDLIYHHKWAFVKPDYKGFNVEESMAWSEFWENHPAIMILKLDAAEKFKNKIGRRAYWVQKVLWTIRSQYESDRS